MWPFFPSHPMWHYWADSPRLRVGSWANNGVLPMAKPQNMPLLNRRAVFSSTNLPQSKFFSYTKHLSNVDAPHPPVPSGSSVYIFHLRTVWAVGEYYKLILRGGHKKKTEFTKRRRIHTKEGLWSKFLCKFHTWGTWGAAWRPGSPSTAALAKESPVFWAAF